MQNLLIVIVVALAGGVAVGLQGPLTSLMSQWRGTFKHHFINRLGKAIPVAACSLLVLTGCAGQPSQAPSPTGSPVASALPTATPLALTPSPSRPARLPTTTPFPTSTPPSWPLLKGEDVLPAPLYFLSNYQIHKIERNGSDRTVTVPVVTDGFDVSPIDGTVVVASLGRLWLVDGDSEYPRVLVTGLPNREGTSDCDQIRDPVWSPDGKQIAYADGGIRVLDLASGKRIDLAENPVVDFAEFGIHWTYYGTCNGAPQWSPLGDAILFRQQGADDWRYMLINLPGNDIVQVPFRPWTGQFAWSSDGKALLFDYGWSRSSNLDPEPSFVRVTVTDLQERVLRAYGDRVDLDYALGGYRPRWVYDSFQAPDGRILFFLGEPCDSLPCPNYSLMEGVLSGDKMNVRALHENVLPTGVDELAWYKSGKYVALLLDKWQNSTIALLRVDTGEIFTISREEYPTSQLRWGE